MSSVQLRCLKLGREAGENDFCSDALSDDPDTREGAEDNFKCLRQCFLGQNELLLRDALGGLRELMVPGLGNDIQTSFTTDIARKSMEASGQVDTLNFCRTVKPYPSYDLVELRGSIERWPVFPLRKVTFEGITITLDDLLRFFRLFSQQIVNVDFLDVDTVDFDAQTEDWIVLEWQDVLATLRNELEFPDLRSFRLI